jgi:hypothetical protein
MWWIMTAVFVLGAASGCDSKGLRPVEGRVTFGGASPPGPGYLSFVPREMSLNQRQDRTGSLPGTALFMRDGRFKATTFTAGDGLRPGTYEVRIECSATPAAPLDTAPLAGTLHDVEGADLVPQGFVPPDLVVPPSGRRPVRYDLDVR